MKSPHSKITIREEWNLTPFFDGDADPRMAEKRAIIKDRNEAFVKKWKADDRYLRDPDALRQALEEYEGILKHWGTGGDEERYFWLRTEQDESNTELKARLSKIEEFSRGLQNEIQFFELKLGKVPEETQRIFLSHQGLQPYRHFLQTLFASAKHALSDAEERIMNLKSAPAREHWVRMTSGFLSREEREVEALKAQKNFSEILSLIDHIEKPVRDSAATAFNDILQKHVDTAEAELNAILLNKKIDDELRGFPRPDSARHLSDDIDTDIVDTVVETVASRFDIPKRFYALKAKLLKLPRLQYHERNVPYGKIDKTYSFEEAVDLTAKVFNNLDLQFAAIFRSFLEEGRVDVYPQKGKHSGAFCAYGLLSHPIYILLNFTGKLRDILTLAHEIGHGINDTLMQARQNALTFGTPLATAEVASTFMEDFIVQELLREADDELRLALMIAKLNDDVSSIFRQIACYRFEQELHAMFREKGYLSKKEIGGMFQKHMASYMGDAVEMSEGSENWWVYWSHIRTFFYVYSYSSGLLISKAMQDQVKKDPRAIEKVKEFLSAGRSDSPKNIFMKLGIDISKKEFWEEGIGEIERLLTETEALAKTLGKIV